jgi:peroxiredoxin
VDLSAHLGKRTTVLLFFPLAFSPVCQAEMCTFRDGWTRWQGLGCDVFGVSVDSPFVVDKFRELERIPFPLLSDFNKEMARAYGALHEDLMGLKGVAKRAAFVVDAGGTVRYAWVSEDPRVQVDFEAIEKAVKAC